MRVIVCVKSVLKQAPDGQTARTMLASELNPYDRPAIALAVRLARETSGPVTAITMGAPDSGGDALLEALARGADNAILLSDPALAGADTLATSTALAAAIARLAPFDLVIFGVRAADADTGQVGPQTAQLLKLPLVTRAAKVERGQNSLTVARQADGFKQTFSLQPPAAITVAAALRDEHDVTLAGLQAAYAKGEYRTWTLADLGLAPDTVGLPGSPTRVRAIRPVRRDRKCEMLAGTAAEKAARLAEWMAARGVIES